MTIPPNILLLICDTARADAFTPWGGAAPTPVVERLSREGTTYRRAVATAPWTLPSTASMFTGLLPTEHRMTAEHIKPLGRAQAPAEDELAAAASSAEGGKLTETRPSGPWLAESLKSRGYGCWGVSCNPWVSSWIGFNRGFDRFEDIRPGGGKRSRLRSRLTRVADILSSKDHGGEEAAGRFERRMAEGGNEPWFAFVNLMELHDPYDPPLRLHPLVARTRPRLPRRRTLPALFHQLSQRRLRERPSAGYLATLRSLYQAAARYEDRLIGRFVRAVEERSGPTVVVVVSDHGENLGEHGLFEHHSSLHETLLHVPLVAWGHGIELGEQAIEGPVSLLRLRAWLEGVADGTTDPLQPDATIVSEYESTVQRPQVRRPELWRWVQKGDTVRVPTLYRHPGLAVREGNLKYVVTEAGDEALHDLERDPGEEHDVGASRPEEMDRLRHHADAWRARRAGSSAGETKVASPDQEIEDHLRMLGYLE